MWMTIHVCRRCHEVHPDPQRPVQPTPTSPCSCGGSPMGWRVVHSPIPGAPTAQQVTQRAVQAKFESLRENPEEALAVLVKLARRISECEDRDEVTEWCGDVIIKTDVYREAMGLLDKVLDILDPEGEDHWFSQEKFHEWLNERGLR